MAVSALGLLSGVLMLPAVSQANRMNQADQKTGDANVGTNTEVGAGDKKEQQPRTAEKTAILTRASEQEESLSTEESDAKLVNYQVRYVDGTKEVMTSVQQAPLGAMPDVKAEVYSIKAMNYSTPRLRM